MFDAILSAPELGSWSATTSRADSQRAADRHAVLSALAARAPRRPRTGRRLRRTRAVAAAEPA